jgi:hypothetical protein
VATTKSDAMTGWRIAHEHQLRAGGVILEKF